MTKDIPEDDQLFTGLKDITYSNYEENANFSTTKGEVEAALATAPNGAIFGSSYHRLPFSMGVSIWNRYADRDSGFARWMTKTFGKQPVLMSWVNPELRAMVAKSVLRNHGYFRGEVSYEKVPQKNPKTSKLSYAVSPGRLYMLDSVGYFGFPPEPDSLIHASLSCATTATTTISPAMLPTWPTPLPLTERCSCASSWPARCLRQSPTSGTSVASASTCGRP